MTAAPVEHRFGPYGGQYVPETLMPALAELEAAWVAAREDVVAAVEAGASAILVGEALMRAADPRAVLRGLLGEETHR